MNRITANPFHFRCSTTQWKSNKETTLKSLSTPFFSSLVASSASGSSYGWPAPNERVSALSSQFMPGDLPQTHATRKTRPTAETLVEVIAMTEAIVGTAAADITILAVGTAVLAATEITTTAETEAEGTTTMRRTTTRLGSLSLFYLGIADPRLLHRVRVRSAGEGR